MPCVQDIAALTIVNLSERAPGRVQPAPPVIDIRLTIDYKFVHLVPEIQAAITSEKRG
jgi:hypothetical protein